MEGVPAGVSLDVFDHVILADESFAAHLAHERFLSRVQTHVAAQVRLVIELFGAERALVRLVAGMFLLMLGEQFGVLEPFAAHVTLERLVAFVERVVVLGQVTDAVEGFVALLTLETAHSVRAAPCVRPAFGRGVLDPLRFDTFRVTGVAAIHQIASIGRPLARTAHIASVHYVHLDQLVVFQAPLHVVVVEDGLHGIGHQLMSRVLHGSRGNWPHPRSNGSIATEGRGNRVWGIAHGILLRINVRMLLLLLLDHVLLRLHGRVAADGRIAGSRTGTRTSRTTHPGTRWRTVIRSRGSSVGCHIERDAILIHGRLLRWRYLLHRRHSVSGLRISGLRYRT